jgi:hypothetical protein
MDLGNQGEKVGPSFVGGFQRAFLVYGTGLVS